MRILSHHNARRWLTSRSLLGVSYDPKVHAWRHAKVVHFWGSGICQMKELLCSPSTDKATRGGLLQDPTRDLQDAHRHMCAKRYHGNCDAMPRAEAIRAVRDPFGTAAVTGRSLSLKMHVAAADTATAMASRIPRQLHECCSTLSSDAQRHACQTIYPPKAHEDQPRTLSWARGLGTPPPYTLKPDLKTAHESGGAPAKGPARDVALLYDLVAAIRACRGALS